MAHVTRSVEVNAPVDDVHQEWLRFEDLPRCAVHSLTVNVRWRAEVLTLQPLPTGTRISLKIEYDPGGADEGLPRRLEGVLETFASFFRARRANAVPQPA